MKGGLKGAQDNNYSKHMGKVWNTLFKKRLERNTDFKGHHVEKCSDGTYVLFVIDMQNDFVDKNYKRIKYENNLPSQLKELDEKNIVHGLDYTGNFAVAQANTMIADLIEKINAALNSDDCKMIYFSRDYHPDGHMSFGHALSSCTFTDGACDFNGKYCDRNNKTGCFPAHCVQCHSGSAFIPEINNLLNYSLDENKAKKIKIIFKGVNKECDSFTAFEKTNIDSLASNLDKDNYKSCGSLSGGYQLSKLEKESDGTYLKRCVNFMDTFDVGKNAKADFSAIANVEKIEVCGLAGDYCVRDTIVALAQKFVDKNVVLLADLTRYAALPIFSMRSLPQHVDEDNKDGYEFEQNFGGLPAGGALELELDSIKSSNTNKSIRHYVFDNGELIDYNNSNSESKNKLTTFIDNGFEFLGSPELTHFITDEKFIIRDYNKANIYIENLDKDFEYAQQGGKRRRRSRKSGYKRRSQSNTSKRHRSKRSARRR